MDGAEVRAFLDVATGDRLSAIWRLALTTGLRRGGLLRLEWDEVDQASVYVRPQVLLRLRAVRRVLEAVVDSEAVDERLERRCERRVRDVEAVDVEFDAHEEAASFIVAMLGGVEDVGSVLEQEARNRRDEALRVRAIHQKNG